MNIDENGIQSLLNWMFDYNNANLLSSEKRPLLISVGKKKKKTTQNIQDPISVSADEI